MQRHVGRRHDETAAPTDTATVALVPVVRVLGGGDVRRESAFT